VTYEEFRAAQRALEELIRINEALGWLKDDSSVVLQILDSEASAVHLRGCQVSGILRDAAAEKAESLRKLGIELP
jgi:hypothetical protein